MAAKQKKKKAQQKKSPAPTPKVQPAKKMWYENTSRMALGLFVFSCLLYANTLGHDFALDDAIVIQENVLVQRGPAGWGELFSHDTFFGFYQDESKAGLVAGGRYRPLSLALFSLERMVSDAAFIHHFFNLLWYGLTVVVLYWLLLALAQSTPAKPTDKPTYRFSLAIPLIAAALFAAHPLHTEVVANIKGRDEILTLLGSLTAMLLAWRAYGRNDLKLAALGGLALFLALLSKENAITFFAVFPVLVFAFRKDFSVSRLAFALSPLAVAIALYLGIRFSILGGGSGDEIRELMNNPFLKLSNGRWVDFTFGEWSATVVYSLGKYLQLLFFPIQLSHDYYPRALEIMTWGDWRVWLSLLANLGLLTLGFLQLRKRPWVGAGILIYFITLSIVSNVFFPVGTLLSERFLFLPSVGFAMAAAWGLRRLSAGSGSKASVSQLGWGLAAVLILAFSVKTIVRNPVWKDNFTLFTTDVQHQPRSAKLQNAAGGAKIDYYLGLAEAVQPSRKNLLAEAVGHLTEAVAIHPTYKQAYNLRGTARMLLDQYDEAVADYDYALELDPGYEDVAQRLIMALQRGGRHYGEKLGDFNRSLTFLQRALQLDGNNYETLRLLGVLNGVSGRREQALTYFKRGTEVQPDNADAWWNLGTAYFQLKQQAAAEQQFARARQIEPGIDARKQRGE